MLITSKPGACSGIVCDVIDKMVDDNDKKLNQKVIFEVGFFLFSCVARVS